MRCGGFLIRMLARRKPNKILYCRVCGKETWHVLRECGETAYICGGCQSTRGDEENG